jgi:hypothetical protein
MVAVVVAVAVAVVGVSAATYTSDCVVGSCRWQEFRKG